MKNNVVVGLIATLLSGAAFASGPDGDSGATGYSSERLSASERSDDLTAYVNLYRHEYSDGFNWGFIDGHVYDTYFFCELVNDENLLAVSKDAETAVIEVDSEDIQSCWTDNTLPATITFDCRASGYSGSKGVSNYETYYYDGFEYKAHIKYANNAVDCVVRIDGGMVLDANSGIVWDGNARIEKRVEPNQEQEEQDD